MSNLNKKRQIIKDILEASFEAGACHISSALSCVDILIDLYYNILKDGDVFIFSKASGVATLYSILADKGYFPKEKLSKYLHDYPLPSKEVPGVVWSGGSLGMGLGIACGIALGSKRKVYCLLSDGECQEGSTMEAVLFAKQHKLDNLYVIIDNNGYQALGKTDDILKIDWSFFKKLPHCKIVKTVKGGNLKFLQGTKGHYHNLNKKELTKALCQI